MAQVFYMPDGTSNLRRLFDINWSEVDSYIVEAQDGTGYTVATSVRNKVASCCGFRIHFINSFDCIDAINFLIVEKVHAVKADNSQQPLDYPLDITQPGIGRININATDSFTVSTTDYPEKSLPWIDELLDAPMAWLEWSGIEGQQPAYLPIVISDTKKQNRKEQDRYEYDITLEFTLSQQRIPLRS